MSPGMRNPVDSTHNQRANMRCEEPAPWILQMSRQSSTHAVSENLEVTELDELQTSATW